MTTYTCPMHPEIQQSQPGACPKCGMALVSKDSLTPKKTEKKQSVLMQYKPLLIIIGLIVLAALTAAWDGTSIALVHAMQYFMATFFFVFSGFKLLDISGFAEGYHQYDLLAKRWYGYGYVYPFLELAFGVAYVLIPTYFIVHVCTIILMGFSGIGVTLKVAKHEKFQCACLGTFINVPLTYITIIEDFGMAAMAAMMLFI